MEDDNLDDLLRELEAKEKKEPQTNENKKKGIEEEKNRLDIIEQQVILVFFHFLHILARNLLCYFIKSCGIF